MARKPRPFRRRQPRWFDRKTGERVAAHTPGAVKKVVLLEGWYAKLVVDGRRQTFNLGKDEHQAYVELARIQRRLREREAGIVDDYLEHAARPVAEHVADWLQSVRHRGTQEEQIELLRVRMDRLLTVAGWKRLHDITPASTLAALSRLQHEPTKDSLGRPVGKVGAQTRNHYLTHVKQFCRWCWENKRLRDHPIVGLEPVNVEKDRRHIRRCPTDEEIGTLFASVDRAPVRKGMTAAQRFLGYRVCMATGFRAGELRSLVPESFDLDAATVTVRAAYSKNGRTDNMPLPAWLVTELREWFAAGGGVWDKFPERHPGRLLKDDLAFAGCEYRLPGHDGPTVMDFHSLRVWYITWAANLPGVSPKTLMTLARHSTPALTLKVYAKARKHDLAAAVEQMPAPVSTPQPEAKKPPRKKRG